MTTPAEMRKMLSRCSAVGDWFAYESMTGRGATIQVPNCILFQSGVVNEGRPLSGSIADAGLACAAVNHLPALLELWEAAEAERIARVAFYEDDGRNCEEKQDALSAAESTLDAALKRLEAGRG